MGFKIKVWARPEGVSCKVLLRRPITQSKTLIFRLLILKGSFMSLINRILLAAAVLLLDLVFFFLPLTAVFFAYIIIFNPPWFREFINHLEPAEKT
jgi:hypothetical protein